MTETLAEKLARIGDEAYANRDDDRLREIVADAPTPTPEQAQRLAALLRVGGGRRG